MRRRPNGLRRLHHHGRQGKPAAAPLPRRAPEGVGEEYRGGHPEGTLTPGPEDEAAIAMAMKNMSTNAKEGREGSLTSESSTKVVSCVKSWGLLGLTVKNSARGAGMRSAQ